MIQSGGRRARRLWAILAIGAAVAAPSDVRAAVKKEAPLRPRLIVDRVPGTLATVRAMVQDRIGFVWFGTDDGLARYDGFEIRMYRPRANDARSLSNNEITALTIDREGRLWVGTDNGINRYDATTDTFTRFIFDADKPDGLTSAGVTALAVDASGAIIAGMSAGGLNVLDPATGKVKPLVEGALEVGATSIAIGADGVYWLGTTGGIVKFDPKSGDSDDITKDQKLSSNLVQAIAVAKDGTVWAGTDAGLNRIDPKTGKVQRYHAPSALTHDSVHALLEDASGTLWVGTADGLGRLDKEASEFIQYRADESDPTGLQYEWVTSLYQDRSGTIWIGALANGVAKVHPRNLRVSGFRTGNKTPLCFAEDPDGSIWVGSYHGGLYRFDRKKRIVTNYTVLGTAGAADAVDLTTVRIWTLYRDGQALWIGTQGAGLIRFEPATESFVQYMPEAGDNDAITTDTVTSIASDPNGLLWLGSLGAGLIKFDPREDVFIDFQADETNAESLPSNNIFTVRLARSGGTLWVGTTSGLARFEIARESVTSWRHDPKNPKSIGADDVQSIYEDDAGILWLGTQGGGLSRFEPDKGVAETFDRAHGLPHDQIYGVLGDELGRLWLSTNGGGMVVFDPKTKQAVVLDHTSGFQGEEYAQGAFFKSRSGEMFFGGTIGWESFAPAQVQLTDDFVPPVVLTKFLLFGEEKALDRPIWNLPSIDLDHDESVIAFQFAALNFDRGTRYAYQLEGVHDRWIETTDPRATYTGLDGGDYVFRVRAANRAGKWTEPVELAFHVNPPWYLSWWAYVLYGLALIALLAGLVQFQRQRVKRITREARLAAAERDIELTGAIQTGFLPQASEVSIGKLRLSGFYRPASVCSGDWWWYEERGDGRASIVVGDVTGHGPGPAMVTAAVATAFRVQGDRETFDRLEVLNAEVTTVGRGKYQMTMSAVDVDPASGSYVLYGAGGLPAIIVDQGKAPRAIPFPGTPLGSPAFHVGQVEGVLQIGSRLIMFSDGIPEIEMTNKRQLGLRRLVKICQEAQQLPIGDAVRHIVAQADVAQAGRPQADDWTLVVVERR